MRRQRGAPQDEGFFLQAVRYRLVSGSNAQHRVSKDLIEGSGARPNGSAAA
jgi:hypothetical protein